MLKKQENQKVEDAVIIASPEQETQALIIAETDKLIETTLVELKKSTVTDEALAHLRNECTALSISDINDLKGYNAVKAAATKVKKIRTSLEAKRKELKEPAIRFGEALDAEAKRIKEQLVPLEEELNKKKQDYEDAVEAAKREEYQRRVNLLTANAYQLVNGFFVCGPIQVHSDELAKITDVQMDVYVQHGQEELKRREAEEQRRQEEAERQRQENERLRLEREALDKEKAEFEAWKAQQQAELKAQTAAIETTYDTVVQPTQPEPSIEFGAPIHGMQGVNGHPDPVGEPGAPGWDGLPPIQNMEAVAHAFVAPEQQPPYYAPQTQPIAPASQHQPQPQAPQPGNALWVPQNEFQRGFNAFRVKLDQLLKSDTKLSKQLLHDWAWGLPFPE